MQDGKKGRYQQEMDTCGSRRIHFALPCGYKSEKSLNHVAAWQLNVYPPGTKVPWFLLEFVLLTLHPQWSGEGQGAWLLHHRSKQINVGEWCWMVKQTNWFFCIFSPFDLQLLISSFLLPFPVLLYLLLLANRWSFLTSQIMYDTSTIPRWLAPCVKVRSVQYIPTYIDTCYLLL